MNIASKVKQVIGVKVDQGSGQALGRHRVLASLSSTKYQIRREFEFLQQK